MFESEHRTLSSLYLSVKAEPTARAVCRHLQGHLSITDVVTQSSELRACQTLESNRRRCSLPQNTCSPINREPVDSQHWQGKKSLKQHLEKMLNIKQHHLNSSQATQWITLWAWATGQLSFLILPLIHFWYFSYITNNSTAIGNELWVLVNI